MKQNQILCRLRLERIKRNQERLAALGLNDGSLKPKQPKKPSHRRKNPRVPLEPTRQKISRSSKKRIDYAELPKLHTVIAATSKDNLFKPPPKELTPEEIKRREKRKKEKRHDDRIPRFIYIEFQRIRSKRRASLKRAKRLFTKAEREKNHWEKVSRKLTAQEQRREAKKAAIREKEARKQRNLNEARLRDQSERDELDCKGMTKKELLEEIELRKLDLYGILAGHDREQSATLEKLKQEAKEKEEIRKRQSLERKLAVIDALDRYPKAMNEALTKLNGLLYSRAPKDSLPPRRSIRRKCGDAFGLGQSSISANDAKAAKKGAVSNCSTNAKLPASKSQYTTEQQKGPPKKKQKLVGSSIDHISGADTTASTKKKISSANQGEVSSFKLHFKFPSSPTPTAKKSNAVTSRTITKKKHRRSSLTLPTHSSDFVSIDSPLSMGAKPNPNSSSRITKKKRRGRPSMTLPIHSQTKSQFLDVSGSNALATRHPQSPEEKNNSTEDAPSATAKKQKKPRDARFIGGWMSPKFTKELDRAWLERTKPIDNRPVILVPENAAKLSGVSPKKTAVFDLGSYVPQAGDIILYYPSAHKDVLNIYPDTLGSRQRNLLRVPLWARASRDRNRLSKEDEKGTIWWTDEWIESLTTIRKSKKDKDKEAKALTGAQGGQWDHLASMGKALWRGDQNGDEEDTASIHNASLGDYPLICRVERTHAEFPEDPYAKRKSTKCTKNDEDRSADGNIRDTDAGNKTLTNGQKTGAETRLSLLAEAEANKKLSKTPPQIRLSVMLKPLSPIIAPCENSGLEGERSLGLPPNFSVVTFPVAAPLEPFIIPFCWGYASFHSLTASETIWIRRSSSMGKDESRRNSDTALYGKGKIVDFFAGAKTKESNSEMERRAVCTRESACLRGTAESRLNGLRGKVKRKGEEEYAISASPVLGGERDSVLLMENIDELKSILACLTKGEKIEEQAISVSLASEKEYKSAIPIREANIIVDFLRKYLEQFEPKTNDTAQSLASSSHQVLSTEAATTISAPSLVGLILKTLPLRQGVLVAFDSNRRQLHKASSWNLVTLQPTDISRSIQDGLLGYLENSLREKAILCMKDLIENNYHAHLFVPMVTELVAPAYYSAVPVGMSLGRVLARLKAYGNTASCYYTSMESILMDLTLISENCLLYNNPESQVVAYCRDIIPKCQTMIKAIIQNRDTKGALKSSENDIVGKRHTLTIPSFLNTPFKGKVNWEWLQRMTPFIANVDEEKVTRQATLSTWIPQCGESIFYSIFNHSKFVSVNHESLDDLQCSVPVFRHAEVEMKSENPEEGSIKKNQDEFLAKASSHWLEGTVVSVRSSFPRFTKKKKEDSIVGVTPILIVELHLHYTQCEGSIFVCWSPTFEGNKCRGSGLSRDSFLKPTSWTFTDGTKFFPSNLLRGIASLPITEDTSISITKCFDFLKQRCIDGISPNSVNPELALENAEHGTPSNFDSQYLPSYPEFFTSIDMKYGTRGIKRVGYKSALNPLSKVGYMPLWGFKTQGNGEEQSRPRHESWMPFPSLCLELIRLRISNGYYKNLHAVVNDISESYICTVLFLLSGPWTCNSDRVSIRKIAKYLMSLKGNGKMSRIAVKKKSKKKKIEEIQALKNKNAISVKNKSKSSKESLFDKLSEEEEALTQQIFQIRSYHASAIVFALEASHVEKIFCLVSTATSNPVPDELPNIDSLKTTNLTPDQLNGVAKIRRLLHAVGRDPCRNRFKISYRDIYKIKIKCGEQSITENGQLETTNVGSMHFEPNTVTASLPHGSQMKITVICGAHRVLGEKKMVIDRKPQLLDDDHTGQLSQNAEPNQFYHSSIVGRKYFSFNSVDLMNNEKLVRALFGIPGRMQPCVRCQALGASLFSCRVLRQHSNPDYDLVQSFKGTSGVDFLLHPWKDANDEVGNDMATTESSKQNTSEIKTISQQTIVDVDEEAKREEEAQKEAKETELEAELALQASKARENFQKADTAHKLARYLHAQAILLSDLEVKLSEDFISTNFPFDPVDNHYVFCIHCGCAGDLLVCESCPNVSHPQCAGLKSVPDGDWFCHKCTAKKSLASKPLICSGEGVCESDRIVDASNNAKRIDDGSSITKHECNGDNSKFEKSESFECTNMSRNEEVTKVSSSMTTEISSPQTLDLPTNMSTNEEEAKASSSMRTEISSPQTLDLPSKQGNVVPSSEGKASENGMKIEETASRNSFTIAIDMIENKEQPDQTINPEINDEELDEKELELEALLTDLINKRLPPKNKPVEQQEHRRVSLDVFGNSYVREFLSFISIESAEQLLSAKTGLIAKDLEMWRNEKGMKPLSADKGYSSAVSSWKNMVRKAGGTANNHTEDDSNLDGDGKSLSTNRGKTNIEEILPPRGRKFCSYLGITDPEVFLAMKTSDLGRKFASWRKKQSLSKLAGDGARYGIDFVCFYLLYSFSFLTSFLQNPFLFFESAYISSWKSKIRTSISFSAEPEPDERSRTVPTGYKVRKLFEDGNYYEGKVISGPNKAFDEEKEKMVLCWRVKYLDDDEEEFTIDELDHWGIGKNEECKEEISGVMSTNTEDMNSVGRASEPRLTMSTGKDVLGNVTQNVLSSEDISSFVVNDSIDKVSANNSFLSSDVSSRGKTSRANPTDFTSVENPSVGTKVLDLQFASEPASFISEGKQSKAKMKQNTNDDWDSSPPIMINQRRSGRIIVPSTAVNGKPIEKAVTITNKPSSLNQAPLETNERRRRSTRTRPSEEAIASDAKPPPTRSVAKSQRNKSSRSFTSKETTDSASRRSTRGQASIIKKEDESKKYLDKADPPIECRRRSSRFSR